MTKAQHHKNLNKLIKDSGKDMHKMMDKALKSGELSDDFTDSDKFLLAKAIITIYGDQHNYASMVSAYRREVENLSHFV